MRFLCLNLPGWPLQRVCAEQPALKHHAVVLSRTDRRGEVVAACSLRAHRSGIRMGTPVAEAQALYTAPAGGDAPRLVVLPHQPLVDRQRLVELARTLQQFSPLVAIEETFAPPHEPTAIFLDLTGLVPLWSSEAELAQAVLDETNRQGWQARVAVADTVGLAWGAARFGQVLDDPLPNPSLAADRPWLIDELPVAALRVEPQTVELLQRLGIEQVGQLLGLPRASLVPRFGAGLLRRLDQLTGRMNEPLVACTEAPPLEASFEFETSIAHAATVLVVLDRLVGQVATAARNQQLGVLQMVATIECDDHSVPPLLVRVLKPTAAERQLVELLRLQAEGLALRSPVKSLRVRVLATGRLECRQTELFATGDESVDWHQMALLVNRLANRLGDNRVVCAERRPSHLPERMVAYAPAVSTRARSFTLDTATASRLRSRPLWLRTRPQRISVTTSGPDERPTHIVDRHRQHDIVEAIGPERIETGWWRDRHRRRDYYRVETSSGDWWWIYRDLRRGMWFAA